MVPVRKSKPEIVYDFLRAEILTGQLKPRQRLVAAQLAKQLAVSEIPVREAIKRLEAESLVSLVPNSGAVVSDITPDLVQELFAMRAVLEGLAAGSACPHFTTADLDRIDDLMVQMQRQIDRGAHAEFAKSNRDFHWAIHHRSPFGHLKKSIADLMDRTEWSTTLFALTPHLAQSQMHDHRLIVDKIRTGDAEGLELLMRQHVDSSRHLLAELVRQGTPLVWLGQSRTSTPD